jgi:hypothetical protein
MIWILGDLNGSPAMIATIQSSPLFGRTPLIIRLLLFAILHILNLVTTESVLQTNVFGKKFLTVIAKYMEE